MNTKIKNRTIKQLKNGRKKSEKRVRIRLEILMNLLRRINNRRKNKISREMM